MCSLPLLVGESQQLSHARDHKWHTEDSKPPQPQTEYPRPLLLQPGLGTMPTSNTEKEFMTIQGAIQAAIRKMYFITETDKASHFFILSADYPQDSQEWIEKKQIVETDCFVKPYSMKYAICDLAQFSTYNGSPVQSAMINSLFYRVLSSEVSVIVFGLKHMGYSTQTEFKFLRTVELTVPVEKPAVCNTRLHTVGHKDRRKRGIRRDRKKTGKSNKDKKI